MRTKRIHSKEGAVGRARLLLEWFERNSPAMQAYIEGRHIQSRECEGVPWRRIEKPSWDYDIEYRVEPEERYAPYTPTEAVKFLLGKTISRKDGAPTFCKVCLIGEEGAGNRGIQYTYETLAKGWEFEDGRSCGRPYIPTADDPDACQEPMPFDDDDDDDDDGFEDW